MNSIVAPCRSHCGDKLSSSYQRIKSSRFVGAIGLACCLFALCAVIIGWPQSQVVFDSEGQIYYLNIPSHDQSQNDASLTALPEGEVLVPQGQVNLAPYIELPQARDGMYFLKTVGSKSESSAAVAIQKPLSESAKPIKLPELSFSASQSKSKADTQPTSLSRGQATEQGRQGLVSASEYGYAIGAAFANALRKYLGTGAPSPSPGPTGTTALKTSSAGNTGINAAARQLLLSALLRASQKESNSVTSTVATVGSAAAPVSSTTPTHELKPQLVTDEAAAAAAEAEVEAAANAPTAVESEPQQEAPPATPAEPTAEVESVPEDEATETWVSANGLPVQIGGGGYYVVSPPAGGLTGVTRFMRVPAPVAAAPLAAPPPAPLPVRAPAVFVRRPYYDAYSSDRRFVAGPVAGMVLPAYPELEDELRERGGGIRRSKIQEVAEAQAPQYAPQVPYVLEPQAPLPAQAVESEDQSDEVAESVRTAAPSQLAATAPATAQQRRLEQALQLQLQLERQGSASVATAPQLAAEPLSDNGNGGETVDAAVAAAQRAVAAEEAVRAEKERRVQERRFWPAPSFQQELVSGSLNALASRATEADRGGAV